jgi:hypothetical protein
VCVCVCLCVCVCVCFFQEGAASEVLKFATLKHLGVKFRSTKDHGQAPEPYTVGREKS